MKPETRVRVAMAIVYGWMAFGAALIAYAALRAG